MGDEQEVKQENTTSNPVNITLDIQDGVIGSDSDFLVEEEDDD